MIEIRTSSRLHFGLLAYSRVGRRQFGGAGLMVCNPEVVLRVRASETFEGAGPLADRALEFARTFVQRAAGVIACEPPRGVSIEVVRVPRPHTGLGSGTQLAMAVGRAMAELAGAYDLAPDTLAGLVGRGKRSGIGVHGFSRGGFLVDGGKRNTDLSPHTPSQPATPLSPLVMRHDFPDDWRIVLIRPRSLEGIAGQREVQAFGTMPDIPDALTDKMCRLILLDLVPSMLERDIDSFGEALFELQQRAGESFAAAQGGIYAGPLLEEIVTYIRATEFPGKSSASGSASGNTRIRGVGQSSWGPTLYAVTPDQASAESVAAAVMTRFDLRKPGEVIVTSAQNHGAATRVVNTPVNAK